jgi:hypothetical protein
VLRSEVLERILLGFGLQTQSGRGRPANISELLREAQEERPDCTDKELLDALFNLDPKNVKIDKFVNQGAGGQFVCFDRSVADWKGFFYTGYFNIETLSPGRRRFEVLSAQTEHEQLTNEPRTQDSDDGVGKNGTFMLTLEKPTLEKIEALQNVMLASVTNGARDEQAYRQLRDELFRIPGLKEALPRFVRTCGDLSQFWHFVKHSDGLNSYANRREHIWNAFRPILSGVDDQAEIEREVFFTKGSDHDAYVHIRTILQAARSDLFLIDPYMDGSIYQILSTLTPTTMMVKVLTSKCPPDFGLERTKFMKQHPGFSVEVRTTRDFHDRFIILDGTKCYLLGASIKDAGNKGFTIVPLQEPRIILLIQEHAKQVWASATALLAVGNR